MAKGTLTYGWCDGCKVSSKTGTLYFQKFMLPASFTPDSLPKDFMWFHIILLSMFSETNPQQQHYFSPCLYFKTKEIMAFILNIAKRKFMY